PPRRLGDRCTHHAPWGLSGEPAYPQAHRGSLWLGQGRTAAAQDARARLSQRRLHDGAHDRLPQPAAGGEAAARPGTDIGDVSMPFAKLVYEIPRRWVQPGCKPAV